MSGEVARQFFAALNARDYGTVRALLHDDCKTGLPGVPPGPEGYVVVAQQMTQSFPDLHHDIIDCIDAGDRVTVVTRNTGTQAEPFMGHISEGRSFNATGIDVLRVEDGQIRERIGVFDTVTMLHQLGLYK